MTSQQYIDYLPEPHRTFARSSRRARAMSLLIGIILACIAVPLVAAGIVDEDLLTK